MKIRQVIRGEYVATPIKNAFNNKTSYWLSKDGCALALYMFTVGNGDTEKEFEERLSQKGFDEFIPIFEEHMRRPFNPIIYREEREKLEREKYEKKIMREKTHIAKKTGLNVYVQDVQKIRPFIKTETVMVAWIAERDQASRVW